MSDIDFNFEFSERENDHLVRCPKSAIKEETSGNGNIGFVSTTESARVQRNEDSLEERKSWIESGRMRSGENNPEREAVQKQRRVF